MHGLCGERLWRRNGHGDQYTTQTGDPCGAVGRSALHALCTELAVLGPPAAAVCRPRWNSLSCTMAPGGRCMFTRLRAGAELGGNHTDHQHGYGLAVAVTLDLVAVASPSDDGFIRVKSRGFNKLDVIDLSEAEPQQGESTHSASLIRGIAEGFRAQGKTVGGFDAYTASDVLRAAGFPARRPSRWEWRPS